MTQSDALQERGHGLGVRILLRAAFESLATLICVNQLTRQVLDGGLSFPDMEPDHPALLEASERELRA